MRVTNVLLLINLNNISNRRPLIVYFAGWKRGCEITGGKMHEEISAPFFLCCFFPLLYYFAYTTSFSPKILEKYLSVLFPQNYLGIQEHKGQNSASKITSI